jgi:hypothetical protein
MFDFFIAPLRCPDCDTDYPNAAIQTHIQGGCEDGSALRVGFQLDAVDLKSEHILGAGYALVTEPRPGGPIRLLDTWSCWRCVADKWAVVEIVDRRIRNIEAVKLDRVTLESANFINALNALMRAETLVGERLEWSAPFVEILRQRLP